MSFGFAFFAFFLPFSDYPSDLHRVKIANAYPADPYRVSLGVFIGA